MEDYQNFIHQKTQLSGNFGFDPIWIPDKLFDFQKHIADWSIRKGRGAIFADCGMGKSFLQLVWAENVVRHTNKRVLVLTPLAVSPQTIGEADKIGVEAIQSRDGQLKSKIVVTNYEKLHLFNPHDFVGVVCDESSILKNNAGKISKQLIRFMAKKEYRLLCTATASPNDYPELGTSSEALGELSFSEMRGRFFRQLDDKGQKAERKKQIHAEKAAQYFKVLSYRVSQSIGQYRLHPHSVEDFWKWVSSWALACRKPSDLGYKDDRFILPELIERQHIIKPNIPPEGMLFTLPARGGNEEREERKRTLEERVAKAAELVAHKNPAVIWCHYNPEGDALEKAIPDAVQIKGSTSDDQREEIYKSFSEGDTRVLVIKPKIGAWGLNWQHCAHVVTFMTHSFEQDYQAIRRCWRFGQKNPVIVDRIASEGESKIMANLTRKAEQSEVMFAKLIQYMNNSKTITETDHHTHKMEVPTWL
jgi:hypothetical protein